jgi:hypothetical protein
MKYKVRVAMVVTEEQFKNYFKQPLEQMGRNDDTWGNWDDDNYLTSRTDGTVGNYGRLIIGTGEETLILDDYNPKLFLALSAMTDKEDGNIGEWWKFIGDGVYCGSSFTHHKLYKQIKSTVNITGVFEDNNGNENGFYNTESRNQECFVKATQEEIIKEFGNNKIKNRILTPQDATRIINIACSIWKKTLAEKWGTDIVLGKNIDISEEFYTKMRNACTTDQNEIFDEIFGIDESLVGVQNLEIGEALIIIKGNGVCKGTVILRTYDEFVDIYNPKSTWGKDKLHHVYGKRVILTITHEEVK